VSLEWPLSEGEDAGLLYDAKQAFAPETPERVGVAVSGGSDSMAMLHLMARAAPHAGWTVHAVTVDHRLRSEAADEAAFVGEVCVGMGVSHDIVVWEHGEITGNLQDQARRARYKLIADWALRRGIGHVCVGHTADDQAETFLMGLAREAGLDGLSGMRPRWTDHGVAWIRPFLAFSRGDLRSYLRRSGGAWVEDPSNADERYQRVKARKVLEALKPMGITVGKLSGVVRNLASVQVLVEKAVAAAKHAVASEVAGEVVFRRTEFRALPDETRRRLLVDAFRGVSGAAYAPRAASVVRVLQAIERKRDATLSGCRVRVSDQVVRIVRELKAVQGLEVASDAVWDGRWQMAGPHAPGLRIRALAADGLKLCPGWRETGISRDALIVSPSIWRGDALLSAPLAGKPMGWTATLVPERRFFAGLH
jgi:tRNA(Ile)-lysidine synthase